MRADECEMIRLTDAMQIADNRVRHLGRRAEIREIEEIQREGCCARIECSSYDEEHCMHCAWR